MRYHALQWSWRALAVSIAMATAILTLPGTLRAQEPPRDPVIEMGDRDVGDDDQNWGWVGLLGLAGLLGLRHRPTDRYEDNTKNRL